jgi:hypothetical protein
MFLQRRLPALADSEIGSGGVTAELSRERALLPP